MRLYEVVYIIDAALDEEAVNAKLEKHHAVANLNGGAVVEVDHWGARQLAYPVRKHLSGYYVVVHIEAEAEALPEFERQLKLDEEVIRYLIVINEGEPTNGVSLVAERPESTKDSTDDDDEEDDDREGRDDDDDSPPEFSGGRGRRRHEGPAVTLLNYKDVSTLSRFLTEGGKILPKRTTKVAARFQRQLGSAVKRARYLALIPYVRDHEA